MQQKVILKITSLSLFVSVLIITFLIFNFLDLYIYELTRTFPQLFFIFFKKIIDPLSDIFDPLNLIIICLIIILLIFNFKYLLKNKNKFNLIKEKTGLTSEKIINSVDYFSLICRHFIVSLALAGILCNLIKYVMGVARPKYFFNEGFERIDFFNLYHKTNSFPSGHTQAAFTVALLFMIYLKRYYFLIFFIAALMGISRIFMSMHFPSDIFFGAYIGAVIPVFLYNFYKPKIDSFDSKNLVSFNDFIKLIYWRIFI